MLWLLSWFALLIFTPTKYIDFLSSRLLLWDNPYIASSLIFVPISYFCADLLKFLSKRINILTAKLMTKKYNRTISKLNDKELLVVLLFAEVGLTHALELDSLKDSEVTSLINKGIIYPVNGCSIANPDCEYQISPKFLKPIEFSLVFNDRIRARYIEIL